jgi:hypothetical protein
LSRVVLPASRNPERTVTGSLLVGLLYGHGSLSLLYLQVTPTEGTTVRGAIPAVDTTQRRRTGAGRKHAFAEFGSERPSSAIGQSKAASDHISDDRRTAAKADHPPFNAVYKEPVESSDRSPFADFLRKYLQIYKLYSQFTNIFVGGDQQACPFHSTVTDFAKFLGLSTSVPRAQAV